MSWQTPRWEVGIAAAWRSGWPTTPASLVPGDDDDEDVAAIGERNSGRLGEFATVDLHVARHMDFGARRLTIFLDVINLFDRDNPCCVEYDRVDAPGGGEALARETDGWLPRMPSLGLRLEF